MQLRPNQEEPTRIGVEFFKKKTKEPGIIVAPTAFGKSIVIAHIANSLEDKTLVLQPSKELLEQNYKKFMALGGEASIYSASFGTKEFGHVTYATIGSIKNIGGTFKELGYKNLIIDEAHLYPRNSDSMFGTFKKSAGLTSVLGLTATPFRLQTNVDYFSGTSISKLVMLTSRNKHGTFFKNILHVTQIKDMVEQHYWSPLKYELYDFNSKCLKYNSTKAEYTDESVREAYKEGNIEKQVINYLHTTDRKRILVFVPFVADAINLSLKVPNSAAVYGDMDKKEREQVINDFKEGKIKVIFNVNVLSVGFDYPEIDCIIVARPTASLAWFYQAVGRGTRIYPTKEDCVIVDFAGNTKRFGRLEDLIFVEEDRWKLYGNNGNLLTGIPLHEIGEHTQEKELERWNKEKAPPGQVLFNFGKYKDKLVQDAPNWYHEWCLKNVTWNKGNRHIKEEIERLSSKIIA